ncbi:MAG TPA: hypothetical protein VJ323_06230 [Bryobacteraceae bacterium]|jgi:hypothetical protein|nr:hypothetical protein [Bryobacteraceae bacterium]
MSIQERPEDAPPRLATSNEPKVSKSPAKNIGDQALRDAITLVVIAWVVLFLLVLSLRGHNL